MNAKKWPMFEDWEEIFGMDRETGEFAEGPLDATEEIQKSQAPQHSNDMSLGFPIDVDLDDDEEEEENVYHSSKVGVLKKLKMPLDKVNLLQLKISPNLVHLLELKMSLDLAYLMKEKMLLVLKMNMLDPEKVMNKVSIQKDHLLMLMRKRKARKGKK